MTHVGGSQLHFTDLEMGSSTGLGVGLPDPQPQGALTGPSCITPLLPSIGRRVISVIVKNYDLFLDL